MKVLLLIDSLGSGGAQKQLCLLATGLHRKGIRVEVMTYFPEHSHFQGMLDAAGVHVTQVKKAKRFSLATPMKIAWHLMAGNFTQVVAFLPTPSIYGAIARAIGAAPCLISSERSSFLLGPPDRKRRFELQVHRLADVVICNSSHHKRELTIACDWLRGKAGVIFNGISLDGTENGTSQPRAAGRPLRLLALSSVIAYKNFAALIEALGVMKAQGHVLPLIRWAGKGPRTSADRLALARAQDRLATLGLAANWEWLGERSDVTALLADCDALIHPSLLEGFPNAIGEAMAAARPVLAGDIGDHARLIRDGENGFLFDPEAPESIAAAIVRFGKTDPETRLQMSRNARATAKQSLGIETMVGNFAGILAKLEHRII